MSAVGEAERVEWISAEELRRCDKKILTYLKKINEAQCVRSLLSCQGHFYKTKRVAAICYHQRERTEVNTTYHFIATRSRVKYPYVLLEFDSQRAARKFVRMWVRNRAVLWDRNATAIYLVRPRNFRYFEDHPLHPSSIIVSRFGRRCISVTFYTSLIRYNNYHKKRLAVNLHIKSLRDFIFGTTLDLVQLIDGYLNDDIKGD